jgi:AmmeMemoRadiSam system protein A
MPPKSKLRLSLEQKRKLLTAARAAIEEKLYGKSDLSAPDLSDSVFSEHYGLFCTLTIDGSLRGCIGYVEGIKPLREAINEMAIQSAFHDPRFNPLKASEYNQVSLEISILYPIEAVSSPEEIMVGRDGLIMERGYHRGLLLPQVATEYSWDREMFMNQTCRKAGMENQCWLNGAKIFKFEAEVFNEKEDSEFD